ALRADGEVVQRGGRAARAAEQLRDRRHRTRAARHDLVVELERGLRDLAAGVALDRRHQLGRELGGGCDRRVRVAAGEPAGSTEDVLLRLERFLPDTLEQIGGGPRHLALAARAGLVDGGGDDRGIEVWAEQASHDAQRRGARGGARRGGAAVAEWG